MKKLLVLLGLATMSATLMCSCEKKEDTGEYEIVVESTEGGSASASRTRADQEMTITLTARPSGDAEFAGWKVLEGVAVLEDQMALTTTFIMPAINVKIRALFSSPTEAGVSFRGLTWATRNVGAPGKFAAPGDWGMGYQFNRNVGWSFSDPVISMPAETNWRGRPDESYPAEWEESKSPCPEGWRIPTLNEFLNLAGYKLDGDNRAYRPKYNDAGQEVPDGTPGAQYAVTYEWDAEDARDAKFMTFTETATGNKMTMLANAMVSSQDPTKPTAMWMGNGNGFYVSATRGPGANAYAFLLSRETSDLKIPRVTPNGLMIDTNAYGIRCVKK